MRILQVGDLVILNPNKDVSALTTSEVIRVRHEPQLGFFRYDLRHSDTKLVFTIADSNGDWLTYVGGADESSI